MMNVLMTGWSGSGHGGYGGMEGWAFEVRSYVGYIDGWMGLTMDDLHCHRGVMNHLLGHLHITR
jgi:hypothetical protein